MKRSDFLAALSSLLAVGCGLGAARAPEAPPDARSVSLSLRDARSVESADAIVAELRKNEVVYATHFDKQRVVLTVTLGRDVAPARVLAAATRVGVRAVLGDAGGSWLGAADVPAGADVATPVTDGHDVTLESVLVAGKITIVDFYADWCAPCREVDTHVKSLLVGRADVAYRRLNVVDWDSPLATHHMTSVPNLPYVLVFDRDGSPLDAIAGLDLPRLDAALAKARR